MPCSALPCPASQHCRHRSVVRPLLYLMFRTPLHPTQEIIGLGLANFAGALFNAYTTTGSFSRSAVNNDSGTKSPALNLSRAGCVWYCGGFLTADVPRPDAWLA